MNSSHSRGLAPRRLHAWVLCRLWAQVLGLAMLAGLAWPMRRASGALF